MFGLFGDKEPAAHRALWDAVLAFLQAYPARFPTSSYKKSLLPKLTAFLAGGCFGSGQASYSSVLPFLSLLPDSSEVLFDVEFSTKLLQSLWKGLKSEAISTSRKDKSPSASSVPLVEAYFECLFLFVVKGSKAQNREEFVESTLVNHLFPIYAAFFKFQEIISPALVPCLVTFVERLEARPECKKSLDSFWTFSSATILKFIHRADAPAAEVDVQAIDLACAHAALFFRDLGKNAKAFGIAPRDFLKLLLRTLPVAVSGGLISQLRLLAIVATALFSNEPQISAAELFTQNVSPALKLKAASAEALSQLSLVAQAAFAASQTEAASLAIWNELVLWGPSGNAAGLKIVLEKLPPHFSGSFAALSRKEIDDMVLNLNVRGSAPLIEFFISCPNLLSNSSLDQLATAAVRVADSSSADADPDLVLGASAVAAALLKFSLNLPLASALLRRRAVAIAAGSSSTAPPNILPTLQMSTASSGAVDETFIVPLLQFIRNLVQSSPSSAAGLATLAGEIVSLGARWGVLSEAIDAAMFSRDSITASLSRELAKGAVDSCSFPQFYVRLPAAASFSASSSTESELPLEAVLQYQTAVMKHAGLGLFSRSHLLPHVLVLSEAAAAIRKLETVQFVINEAILVPTATPAVALQVIEILVSHCRSSSVSPFASVVAKHILDALFSQYEARSETASQLAEQALLLHFVQNYASLEVGFASSIGPSLINQLKPNCQTLVDLRKRVFEKMFVSQTTSSSAFKDTELAVALELALLLVSSSDDADQRKILSSFVPLARHILSYETVLSPGLICALSRFSYTVLLDQFDVKITPTHWEAILDICRSAVLRELKNTERDLQVLNEASLLLRSICTMESSKFEWAALSVDVFPPLFDLFVSLESSASSATRSEIFMRNLARTMRLIPVPLLKTIPTAAALYPTLTALHVETQFTSYSLLKSLAQDKLSKIASSSGSGGRSLARSAGSAKGSSDTDVAQEEDIDTSALDPELKRLLEDADMYAPSENVAPRRRFHTELGLLLAWSLLLEHLDPAVCSDAKTRSDIGTYVRRLGLLDFVLSLVFAHLQEGNVAEVSRDLEASKIEQLWASAQNLDDDDTAEAHLLSSVSAYLFRRVLEALPAMVRSWWTSLGNRLLRGQVEKFTTKFVSPLLIPRELAHASTWKDPACDYFSIRTSSVTSEVSATYKKDEAELTSALQTKRGSRRNFF